MKKMYKFFMIFFLSFSLLSCDREIMFDNNYELSMVKPAADVSFIINQENQLVLELTNLTGSDVNNYTYLMDYQEIDGDLDIKVNSFQLIKGTFIPVEFKDNKLVLLLKPLSLGVISFKIILKDSSGKIKEIILQITGKDIPNTYDFVLQQSVVGDLFAGKESILLANIKSTGNTTSNFYNIKYNGTPGSIVKYNNVRLLENSFVQVNEGNLSFTYSNSDVGLNKIAFTVKNAQGVIKELFLNIKTISAPVEIIVPTNLDAKELIQRNFDLTVSNLIANSSYSIRFSTPTNANITIKSNAGTIIPIMTFVPMQSINGIINFSYLTNQGKNEILTVEIKDSNNNIVSKSINVIVNPKPVIQHVKTSFQNLIRNIPKEPTEYSYSALYEIDNVIVGSGETIVEYYITSKNNVWTQQKLFFSGTWEYSSSAQWGAFPYTVRVKDSSGRWSNDFTGVWSVN